MTDPEPQGPRGSIRTGYRLVPGTLYGNSIARSICHAFRNRRMDGWYALVVESLRIDKNFMPSASQPHSKFSPEHNTSVADRFRERADVRGNTIGYGRISGRAHGNRGRRT